MTDIIIQGIHGRMGRALCTMIEARTDCRVVAGVDAKELPSAVPVFPSLEKNTVPADVLIDFSNPDATQNAIEYCRAHKLPCVICTTGLSEGQEQALRELSKTVAVFKSEKHHHNKLDAPSGTALMIADELCGASPVPYHYVYDRHAERRKREPTEIGIHAVRGGSIVGEHEVIFAGPEEVITISHSAGSREVFANGALNAAVFLAGKPAGMYNMKDLMHL